MASTIGFPVMPIRFGSVFSAMRLSAFSWVAAQWTSARAPTTRRLCSSGMARSWDRRPAATWMTGMPQYCAAWAPALVELLSP